MVDGAKTVWIEAQPVAAVRIVLNLADHPSQRDERQVVVRVAAADVRVHAGKPDLLDALGVVRARLVPQHRLEGVALVVDRDRVAGAIDLRRQLLIGEAVRVEDAVDHRRQLVDRKAHGIDGVPDADEPDLVRAGQTVLSVEVFGLRDRGPQVPQPAEGGRDQRLVLAAIAAVGEPDPGVQSLAGVQLHGPAAARRNRLAAVEHAAPRDQTCERARGEGAAAETEDVDLIACAIVPAEEPVELADVARQAPAERAAEQPERPEAGRPDAVVVIRDLVVATEIERLIERPDVGLVQFGGTVASAVRQQDDVARRALGRKLIDDRFRRANSGLLNRSHSLGAPDPNAFASR